MIQQNLIDAAIHASTFSYSPYSGYAVGSSILGSNGKIYEGCNIENVSFPASTCAERTAIVKMVSDGCREVKELVIYTVDGAWPCGNCLQTMSEFIPDPENTLVHCVSNNNDTKTLKFSEIFPSGFQSEVVKKTSA